MMKTAVFLTGLALVLGSSMASAAYEPTREVRLPPITSVVRSPVPFQMSAPGVAWRYDLLRPHCDGYAFEVAGLCGTATGGPSGGIN